MCTGQVRSSGFVVCVSTLCGGDWPPRPMWPIWGIEKEAEDRTVLERYVTRGSMWPQRSISESAYRGEGLQVTNDSRKKVRTQVCSCVKKSWSKISEFKPLEALFGEKYQEVPKYCTFLPKNACFQNFGQVLLLNYSWHQQIWQFI